MPARFEARFLTAPAYEAAAPVGMTYELSNLGDEDALVLTWYTPLEGLWSDCVRVLRGGEQVPYDGPLAKRGQPSASDYVLVAAGSNLRVEVELGLAYNVSVPGEYNVTPRPRLLDVVSGAAARRVLETGSARPLHERPGEEREAAVMVTSSAFIVRGSEGEPRSLGALLRRRLDEEGGAVSSKTAAPPANPAAPVLVGGTATQQAEVKAAHNAGYGLVSAALSTLTNDAQYTEWFGAHTATRMATVRTTYSEVKNGMETDTFTYDLTGDGCRSRTYAYTTKGGRTVWLCELFWTAPATGTDSQAGTVLHELCHALGFRDDIAYGQSKCRALAINTPDDAIKNADSHEYHAKG